MPIIHIDGTNDPRLSDFEAVPDPELLRCRNQFVVEGRFAIQTLLQERRFHLRSLLLTESTFSVLARALSGPLLETVFVYVTSAANFKIGGYNFHRGYLALVDRPDPVPVCRIISDVESRNPILALDRIGNPDNIGGIFRNAAAFSVEAVLLSPGCCDPLYRKAIRTSIGKTLQIPFSTTNEWPSTLDALRAKGYVVVALTPDHKESIELNEFLSYFKNRRCVVWFLGSEGDGLSEKALEAADFRVRIPLNQSVDSLNVATAAAIALHRLWDYDH